LPFSFSSGIGTRPRRGRIPAKDLANPLAGAAHPKREDTATGLFYLVVSILLVGALGLLEVVVACHLPAPLAP